MNPVALITGASRGIGAACARRFARSGYSVAILYRSRADLAEALVQQLISEGQDAFCLQADVADRAQAFAAAGIDAQHEARLGPRCRIDFLCGNVGVEIKKSRPERGKLIAQLTRYAGCDQVAALVVVAPRGVNLPKTIGGKPAAMLALERLWGIWLP